ncbi:MAG: leucine-rich repeat domain-containing protein [Alphaproteobacteria bacterium]|nr:leucine-rich repeat domain-containing protein [Alphaproteobacteria bacterium]
MKKIFFILGTFISLNSYAAHDGWKNCDDDGTANCEYQIKDGVLTVRPQDNSQPASIPDYQRDCTRTRYADCTTPAPWRWDENANTVKTLKIESGISSIGEDAFEDMKITTANLPDSVTSIGKRAFIECDWLTDVNLPNNLQTIGASAFASVPLTNVVVPDTVTMVDANAFRDPNPAHKSYAFEEPYAVDEGPFSPTLKTFVVGENTILDEFLFTYSTGVTTLDLNNFKMYCASGNESCVATLQKTLDVAKNQDLVIQSMQISDLLTTYTKDSNGFYQIDDKLYATADLMTHNAACDDAANCQAILDAASQGKPFEVGGKYYATLDLFANGAACTDKKNCEDILSSNGNPFKVGSKVYNSIADFANGNYVKHRIYTIEEANFVAGDKNRVSIRYR